MRVAVATSAVVHAAVIAWLATRTAPPRRPVRPAAPALIELVPVPRPPAEVVPMDVALVEVPAAPAAPLASTSAAAAVPRPARGAPDRTPTAPGAPSTSAPAAGSAAPGPTQPGSLLTMRRGGAPQLALSGERWAELDHAPPRAAPDEVRATGKLRTAGGGRYKADQGTFGVDVAPDGSVTLTDRRNLNVHVALPRPRDLGNAVTRWYRSDKGPYGKEGDTSAGKLIQIGPGAVPGDPATGEVDHPEPTVVVPVLGGGFDTTDWLMRRRGQDPYAAKKLAFLDSTRDERVQLGRKHRAQQLVRSPQLMRKNLDALWAQVADLAARKQALFELWDECAETGEPEVVAGGRAARLLVIGFIRAHLPAGSADAFTPAELAAFARRQQSKAPFQPYD